MTSELDHRTILEKSRRLRLQSTAMQQYAGRLRDEAVAAVARAKAIMRSADQIYFRTMSADPTVTFSGRRVPPEDPRA